MKIFTTVIRLRVIFFCAFLRLRIEHLLLIKTMAGICYHGSAFACLKITRARNAISKMFSRRFGMRGENIVHNRIFLVVMLYAESFHRKCTVKAIALKKISLIFGSGV